MLVGHDGPLRFASVRDAIAFTRQGDRRIAMIYVSDMAKARGRDAPAPDLWPDQRPDRWPAQWISAHQAWYIIGSRAKDGRGRKEVVPFSSKQAAQIFKIEHGGRLVFYAEIPPDYLLAEKGASPASAQ